MGDADEDEPLHDDVDDDQGGARPGGGPVRRERSRRRRAPAPAAEAPAADAPGRVRQRPWWTTDVEGDVLLGVRRGAEVTFFAEKSNGKSKGTACVEFEDAAAAKACR